ncbi:MAG TPA: hypothetical protein VH138_07485, partial [Vicinamibacterales bacterium]|nr:hypothetical protein [Vicinamibacterales bacterium]
MTACWDVEAVHLGEVDRISVAEFRGRFGGLFVPHVGDALEEQQWEDVRLPVRPIDGAPAEDLGAVPEVLSQIQSHASTHLAAVCRLGEQRLQFGEDRSLPIGLEVHLMSPHLSDHKASGGQLLKFPL